MSAFLRNPGKRGLLLRFSLAFSCLATLPVALVSLIHYRYSSDALEDQIYDSCASQLAANIRSIDEKLSALRDSILVFAFSYEDRQVDAEGGLTDEFRYRILQTAEDLKKLVNANTVVETAFICFADQDTVISIDGQYSFEYFLDHIHVHEGCDSAAWREYLRRPHRFEYLETGTVLDRNAGTARRLLPICTSIPFSEATGVALVVTVGERLLVDHLRAMDIGDTGGILVFDEERLFVSEPGNGGTAEELDRIRSFVSGGADGRDRMLFAGRLITRVRSSFTGWSYVTAIPRAEILRKTEGIKATTLIACGAFFAAGLIVSILMGIDMYRPIGEILRVIEGKMTSYDARRLGRKDEYGYICSTICTINRSNTALGSFVTQNLAELQEKLLFDIVNGSVADARGIESRREKLGLDFGPGGCVAVVCTVDYYRRYVLSYPACERAANEATLLANITAYLSRSSRVFRVNGITGATVFVLALADGATELGVAAALDEMLGLLEDDRSHMRLTLGVGRVYHDVMDLRLSFLEAAESVELRKMTEENQLIRYADERSREFEVFRLADQERMITNSILAGEHRHALELIAGVIDRNVRNGVPYRHVREIVTEVLECCRRLPHISGCLADVCADLRARGEAECISSPEDMKEYLGEVFSRLGEHCSRNGGKRNEGLKKRIIQIVEENYGDDLCLELVASKVSMSPKYFSSFFSHHFGENFARYLMRVRMNRASELLRDTGLRVKEIARSVGYRNVNSFVRAYRNSEGVSPGKIRRQPG